MITSICGYTPASTQKHNKSNPAFGVGFSNVRKGKNWHYKDISERMEQAVLKKMLNYVNKNRVKHMQTLEDCTILTVNPSIPTKYITAHFNGSETALEYSPNKKITYYFYANTQNPEKNFLYHTLLNKLDKISEHKIFSYVAEKPGKTKVINFPSC